MAFAKYSIVFSSFGTIWKEIDKIETEILRVNPIESNCHDTNIENAP